MKFQNPSFKFFLNGRTNAHTDTLTSRKQYAPHFFKVGGIIKGMHFVNPLALNCIGTTGIVSLTCHSYLPASFWTHTFRILKPL